MRRTIFVVATPEGLRPSVPTTNNDTAKKYLEYCKKLYPLLQWKIFTLGYESAPKLASKGYYAKPRANIYITTHIKTMKIAINLSEKMKALYSKDYVIEEVHKR